jgi:3-oxoacyl-[acyl-carrier protein] reductase
MILAGRRCLITGANQGLGLAIARAYAIEGADVCLCARDSQKLDTARKIVQADCHGRVLAQTVDISDAAQHEELIHRITNEWGGLDVAVCNAGIYGPKGRIEEVDWQAWAEAIQINLLGTVLTCRAVVPMMKAARSGKIIVISGGGATKPMPQLSAYAASKAGVVRFAETLAEELTEFGIDVNSVAPGALNTRLLDEVLAAGPEKVGPAFYQASLRQKETGGDSLELGAALCVWLASAASNALTGKLLSAKWDPWRDLGSRAAELRNSDVYTLRRIVPADRGWAWGDPPQEKTPGGTR